MPDPIKPTSPTPTRTQLATAPTVLISPGGPAATPRRVLAPRTRMQRFFSADNLRETAKTLAIVAVVTLFIWGWAEREQVQEKSFTVTLRPITPADQYASIKQPNVSITLSGPNGGIEEFAKRMSEGSAELSVVVPRVDASKGEVTKPMNVADLLGDQKFIRDAGLTVKGGTQVEFVIDQMREQPIDVQVPAELKLLTVTAEPATVMIRGPRLELQKLPSDAAAVLAPPNIAELRKLTTPGSKKVLTDVPIKLNFVPDSQAVQLVQSSVATVTFSVPLALEDRATINYFVAPRFDIPADSMNRRVRDGKPAIVVTGSLQGLAVVGPRDVVAKVDSEDFKRQVFARILITRDNLLDLDAGKTIEVTPEILLPPGVRVDGAIPTLKLSAPLAGSTDARQ
jgi:hypothetical protein